MNQIAIKDEPQGLKYVPDASADPITALIGKVAADPNASIETLERMIALRDKEQLKADEKAFNLAFSQAQKAMPAIPKRGKGYQSDYALWEDVNKQIIAVLSANEMSISYTSKFDAEAVTVTATLRHSSGHSISGEFYSPIESPKNSSGKASMNKAQARGSAMTYGKRYATINLLSLTTHGEDDDAFSTSESDFDTTPWTDAFINAADMDALNIVGAKMGEEDIPEGALKMLRMAWAGRANEIAKKAKESDNAA